MTQSFRPIKISTEDKLYSLIIRFGHTRCVRCHLHKTLQCAHIIERGHQATRWMLKPYRNAIPLCSDCHSWFDTHKDDTPLFNEDARQFSNPTQNKWAFLVTECGYHWKDLYNLWTLGHRCVHNVGHIEKIEIRKQLKAELKRLEKVA